MSKKIVKVMVFYEDGTFDECIAGAMHVGLQYPPGVRGIPPVDGIKNDPRVIPNKNTPPWTPVVTPGCTVCGEFRTGFCGKAGCPNNHINPWDNSNTVRD
jgi:hypothetical protein